jgi:WD40 repeat protein
MQSSRKKKQNIVLTTNDACVNYFVVPPQAPCFYQIWDLQTKTCIKLINGLQEYACNIAVVQGPSGRPILLTVSEDHTVAFCDSTTHRYHFYYPTLANIFHSGKHCNCISHSFIMTPRIKGKNKWQRWMNALLYNLAGMRTGLTLIWEMSGASHTLP